MPMRILKPDNAADETQFADEAATVLSDGGLVCLPAGGRYRLVADLTNSDAVLGLMQAKGRVQRAPALFFISGEAELAGVADDLDPLALSLARKFWPQPLTVRVHPSQELPRVVRKQLGGGKSRVGVRVPDEPLIREVLALVGKPLLVSSANRERKHGETSPAQVRKSFAQRIDLFLDIGDLTPAPLSTVIDVVNGRVVIEREGAVSAAQIEAATDA